MGLHDLPALVDYVLDETHHAQLHYIGHSMGSTGMLVLLSSRPEYNRKIRLASFLGPVAYVSTLRSVLFRRLSAIAPLIKVSQGRAANSVPLQVPRDVAAAVAQLIIAHTDPTPSPCQVPRDVAAAVA